MLWNSEQRKTKFEFLSTQRNGKHKEEANQFVFIDFKIYICLRNNLVV